MAVVVRALDANRVISLIEKGLGDLAASLPASSFVCIGDTIQTDEQEGFLRGHGTQVVDGRLVATLCGVVERVNKLVYVKPLKSRYSAELGDVVVGRITDVVAKKWKVDLQSRQEAMLLLSAVNLPGGIQRRRTAEDELNMRSVFVEGDLITAEVQSFYGDGAIALHTRSLKYGRLAGGQLVTVAPGLVRRQKQHFVHLEAVGVDVILGLNGLVWVSPHIVRNEDGSLPAVLPPCSAEARHATVRVAGAIRALEHLYLPIYPAAILDAYAVSVQAGVEARDMLEQRCLAAIVASEAARRRQGDGEQ